MNNIEKTLECNYEWLKSKRIIYGPDISWTIFWNYGENVKNKELNF